MVIVEMDTTMTIQSAWYVRKVIFHSILPQQFKTLEQLVLFVFSYRPQFLHELSRGKE